MKDLTIDEVRAWFDVHAHMYGEHEMVLRFARTLMRQMEAGLLRRTESEAETPSEAEARGELERFSSWMPAGRTMIDRYRAAVLREADAETVALVERLREHVVSARSYYTTDEGKVINDADAWLAARGKGTP